MPLHFLTHALEPISQKFLAHLEKTSSKTAPTTSSSEKLDEKNEFTDILTRTPTDSIDLVNKQWLLDYFEYNPIALATYYLRDMMVTTRDERTRVFVRLVLSNYDILNNADKPCSVNTTTSVLALCEKIHTFVGVSAENKELNVQMLNNNLARLIENTDELKNNAARVILMRIIANSKSLISDSEYKIKQLIYFFVKGRYIDCCINFWKNWDFGNYFCLKKFRH